MIWTKRWRSERKARRIARVAALLRRELTRIGNAPADWTDEELAKGAAEMENELRREKPSPLQVRRVRTISTVSTFSATTKRR
jgi:hypothetical protein